MKKEILTITQDLLLNPTAPYRELHVRDYILAFCKQRNIHTSVDSMGNVLATYGKQHKNTPLVFVAHQDHPGFIVESDSRRGRTSAIFHGGVERDYFRKGTKIKIYTANGPVAATLTRVHFDLKKKEKRVWIAVKGDVHKGDLGMWDLPPCRIEGDRLTSRACDDVVGCALILSLFDQLVRQKVRQKIFGLFTVAEEAGLHGAKFACLQKMLPKKSVIISIETSSALPTAPIGKGVVIRVGDRSNVFHPAVTKWMQDVASGLQKEDKLFQYQRKLMDAGTCEASIFCAFGYTAGAVCIPLGNYHNRNFKTRKIAAEFVSVSDYLNMLKFFFALVNKGVSGVKLALKQPTFKKRIGGLGELFWE